MIRALEERMGDEVGSVTTLPGLSFTAPASLHLMRSHQLQLIDRDLQCIQSQSVAQFGACQHLDLYLFDFKLFLNFLDIGITARASDVTQLPEVIGSLATFYMSHPSLR